MNGQINKYVAAQCPYKRCVGIILSPTPGFINGFIEEGMPAFHTFIVFDGNVWNELTTKSGKQSWTAKCVSVKMSHFPELFFTVENEKAFIAELWNVASIALMEYSI